MAVNKADVERYIFVYLKDEYDIDVALDGETNIQDAGLDSLDIVSFLFNIEKKYNVRIPNEELENREMFIINNIVSYILGHS